MLFTATLKHAYHSPLFPSLHNRTEMKKKTFNVSHQATNSNKHHIYQTIISRNLKPHQKPQPETKPDSSPPPPTAVTGDAPRQPPPPPAHSHPVTPRSSLRSTVLNHAAVLGHSDPPQCRGPHGVALGAVRPGRTQVR